MKRSLKKQMAFFFIGLMAFILAANWVINNAFLENFYILRKQNVLVDAYNAINQVEDVEDYLSAEFTNLVSGLCEKNNITMVIVDNSEKLRPIFGVNDWDVMAAHLWEYIIGVEDPSEIIISKQDDYTILKKNDRRTQMDSLEIWGMLDTGYYFAMRIPLESIRENVRISNEFLTYFSIIGIILSIIIIWWLAKKFTDPILELTNLSKRMADLDFDAKYTSGGINEIGQLGDHFNKMAGTLEDTISELKTANNELQKDIEKKTQIDEMRKEFLANVSHELKTPIALIQGYAEGLKECINDDAQSRDFYCEVIMDEASKMNQMVKKLLTLNQLEFGNDTVNLDRFDIINLIKEVIQSTNILAQQKHAKIIFRETKPVYVWADEYKVEEVVTNYISNALNHVDDDRVIEVKVQKQGKKVHVSVFNTGTPIPDEDLDKIWIKFYKVDKARTREYGGNGIGLSIVKAIMDSFHQDFGVVNYDNGVEFWFELDGDELQM